MIKNILVPIDGSEHAIKPLILANDLADKYGADLSVLFVIDKPNASSKEALQDFIEMEYPKTEKMTVTAYLNKLAEKTVRETLEKAKVKTGVQPVILSGDPSAKIVDYVKTNDIDMVIMASRGKSGITDFLVGSVTYKVSRSVKCSCVIIR